MPPGLPCRRSRRQSDTIPNGTGVPIAIRRQDWWRGPHDCVLHLNPPLQSGACRQACHAGGHAGRATQSRTVRKSNAIRRQDWRRGTHDCALHLKPPPQSGASRQACHAGGHAGRATQSRTVRKSNAIRHQDWWRGPQDCALHLNPPRRVDAAQRVRPPLFPCPCPPWFAFSVPSPPPVTTFPKSFSLSFSTTSQLALSPPLAPILYVESERCG